MAGSLKGRVAAVTGGSRGIGRAIVLALAERGADVAFCYSKDEASAREVEELLRNAPIASFACRCDVSDESEVSELFGKVEEQLGPVDILVNNAGLTQDALILFMDSEKWKKVMGVNLDGAFYCIRSVCRGMMLKRWGRIINIVSPSGIRGTAGQCNYSAAKAGMIGLTRSLAREVGPQGILVNAVSPGLIESDLVAKLPDRHQQEYLKQVPLGRLGTPEEVGRLVAFLASDEASYINGQVMGVDGGLV